MKKFLYIIAAGLLLSDCTGDFLEKQPLDKMSEADIYSNAALATVYANSFYTILEDTFTEANVGTISDESWFRYGGNSTRIVASTFYTPDTFQYNNGLHATRITFLNIWEKAYKGIRNINDFLTKMEDSPIADDDKKSLMGEAYFFRAWLYSNLIQRYGGVPIVKTVYGLNDEFKATRASFDECVDFILSDLKLAKENLPAYDKAVKGRPNKDIAMALEARFTLIAASAWFNDESDPTPSNPLTKGKYSKDKWTRALAANKAFIDECAAHYSLPASYSDFWKNQNSTEIIWAKYFNNGSGDATGTRKCKAQLYYAPAQLGGWRGCEPTEALIIDYEMISGKKFFEAGSGYDPVHPWANRDPRFYDSIIYPGSEVSGQVYDAFQYFKDKSAKEVAAKGKAWASDATGYSIRKFLLEDQPVSESVNSTTHHVWFRLAEMYLNYAECCYMTGAEGTARDYINLVRARAGMPAITETGANLFDRLVNERRIELAFECGFRYFDLRRWKLAEYYEQIPWMGIYAYAYQDKLDDPNATDDEKYDYRIARVYDETKNTWPIDPAQEKRVYKYTWLGKDYFIDFGDCHHQMAGTNKRFLKDRNYLLPIGTLEIEKSEGSIVQNPGYEKPCPTNEENYSVYPTGFVDNPQLAGIDFTKF